MTTIINWEQAIDSYLKSKDHRKDPYEPDLFSASSVSGCIRQCVRTRLGLGSLGPQTLRHFYLGSALHKFLQTEVALGFINQPVEFEKRIAFEMEGIRFKGHIDCVTETEILDFKSTANIPTTTSFPTSQSYLYQLAIYKQGLHQEGVPDRETAIIYIDKRNLDTVRVPVQTPPMSEIIFFCKSVIQAEAIYAKQRILHPKDGCYSCSNERD